MLVIQLPNSILYCILSNSMAFRLCKRKLDARVLHKDDESHYRGQNYERINTWKFRPAESFAKKKVSVDWPYSVGQQMVLARTLERFVE